MPPLSCVIQMKAEVSPARSTEVICAETSDDIPNASSDNFPQSRDLPEATSVPCKDVDGGIGAYE